MKMTALQKFIILIITTLILWLFVKCDSKGGSKVLPSEIQRDSSRRLMMWLVNDSVAASGIGYRIIKDTTMFLMKDSITFKKEATKDTQYYLLRDSMEGGKMVTQLMIPVHRSVILMEANHDVDSTMMEVGRKRKYYDSVRKARIDSIKLKKAIP